MGLDIYLYTKAEHEQNEAHHKEEVEFYGGEDWPLYDEKTEEERAAFRNNRQFEWTSNTDVPSVRYGANNPLNNRRYLRSSYNGGGFNSAVPRYLGNEDASYYGIFAGLLGPDEYEKVLTQDDVPVLAKAAIRAFNVSDELANIETPLSVMSVGANMFAEPPTLTDMEALEWAKEQVQREKENPPNEFFGPWWSNNVGNYFGVTEPIEVVALVPGKEKFGFRQNDVVHVVYKAGQALQSYVESAYIAGEFAEEAIDLIERDGSAYIMWSG